MLAIRNVQNTRVHFSQLKAWEKDSGFRDRNAGSFPNKTHDRGSESRGVARKTAACLLRRSSSSREAVRFRKFCMSLVSSSWLSSPSRSPRPPVHPVKYRLLLHMGFWVPKSVTVHFRRDGSLMFKRKSRTAPFIHLVSGIRTQ